MVRIERSNKVVEYKYSSSLSRNNINNRLNAKASYGIAAHALKCEQWIDFHSTIFGDACVKRDAVIQANMQTSPQSYSHRSKFRTLTSQSESHKIQDVTDKIKAQPCNIIV